MTIEFADPGYNWAFVWWPLFALLVFLAIFIWTGIAFDWDEADSAVGFTGALFVLALLAAAFVPSLFGTSEYGFKVTNSQRAELQKLGFSDVEVSGDRFTAATEDGQYFRGALVDLRPDEGYAYQVLELKGTEN